MVDNIQITQTEIDYGGRAVPRRWSAATRLLGSRVQIPLRAWMFFPCVLFVGYGPLRRADYSCRQLQIFRLHVRKLD